jgi:hypothetical protein
MGRGLLLLFLIVAVGGCVDGSSAPKHQGVRQSTQTITPRPEARACLGQLGKTNAAFTPLPDQYYGAGCSTLNTVRLLSLRSDSSRLGLSNLGPVACPLANTFADWARFGVDRAARQILGSPLVRIETMGSYSCRTVAGSSKLSAHATANAIDVAGFVLENGRRITILGNWSAGTPQERQFLQVIHASACKRFGTVLGPGYNAAHRDHLHLELSGKSYCR